MIHNVRIPCRSTRTPSRWRPNAGMNLWLTQKMNAEYRVDWRWDTIPGPDNHYLYSFNDEKLALLFALRWA